MGTTSYAYSSVDDLNSLFDNQVSSPVVQVNFKKNNLISDKIY